MENPNSNKRNTAWLIIVLLVVVICVAVLVYTYWPSVYATADSLKLIPMPERFTELYFTDPSAIPASATAGQPMSFAFTVHNLEGVTTTYPYTAYFEYSTGGTIPLMSGIVSLSNDASTTIPISYTFSTSSKNNDISGEVVVALPTLNDQQIDFIIPYTN